MASSTGPDVVTDGLVLALDGADITSFRGEPTTNLFLNPTFIGTAGSQTSLVSDNWIFSGYTGDTGFKFYDKSNSPIPLKFENEGSVITTNSNTEFNRRIYCTEVLEPGQTYTVSAWLYTTFSGGINIAHFEYGGANLNSGYFLNVNTHPNFKIGSWFYWEDTYTVGADYTNGFIGPVIGLSTPHLFGVQRFQIEKKPYATPFVNGTRGATVATGGGWADLSGNTNHGELVNGVGYDSGNGGSLTFDGSDDYVNFTDNSAFNFENFSIDIWFKFEGVDISQNSDRYGLISKSNTAGANPLGYQLVLRDLSVDAGGILLRVGDGSTMEEISGDEVTDILLDGNYHNITAVWKNGDYAFTSLDNVVYNYTNISFLNITNNSPFYIGRWTLLSDAFDGKISSVRIYNRALTAEEISQNFNATRGRFGI